MLALFERYMAKKEQELSMVKVKEVFRLRRRGLSQRQIATSCNCGRTTVQDYLHRAESAALDWNRLEEMSEDELAAVLGRRDGKRYTPRCDELNYEALSRELCSKGVTLQLLWDEYRQVHPEGYAYSHFCALYAAWRKRHKFSMRQTHKAGEKAFVDYAGQTVPIHDRQTGSSTDAQIFVAVLGASNLTYAEASSSQSLPCWIGAHQRAFQFFGGVPESVVPDNLKAGVKRACFYDPVINPTYQEFSEHYGFVVLPARVRKPKDKAKAEVGVQIVERWILAALRKEKFFSLEELNARIRELLQRLNDRVMRAYGLSRAQLFEQTDKPALHSLPVVRYEFGAWKKARVNIDYHVEIERHWYSVPYQLLHEEVDCRVSERTIEVFHKNKRVAVHARSSKVHGHTTLKEHMPPSHQWYMEWSPQRLLNWAAKIGPNVAKQAGAILAQKQFPEQAYRAVLGLIRLECEFGSDRLEAACQRMNHFGVASRRAVHNALKSGHDKLPLPEVLTRKTDPHSNIRGEDYYH